ncbi:vesicle trafficking 1 [Dermatophagoides pteronyssinus]|uniref:Vacuolar protein sorting-associated protein vts1-like n=1 Tax=Dermatophagoides pteronyssinus TaxID=6956 RepID=A0A6P6YK88_DERPT|nr:vacuolar protein sorting-associated protein vts1-like [Dermatophagoides pteronyssinus]XP_027205167.1 vacuolar protein sorting-associated protein vts1-like [Dermatophagoides pteronyssinus]
MDQQILETFLKQSTTKPIYKQYLPFMKLARDSFAQNPILTYWTLCYVVEAALKNQTKPTDDFRKFLLEIMSCLEKEKKSRIGDNLFWNEKDAQKFIEEYGNKLVEKAEENEELMERYDLAYKLYLTASNIFQMYTVFVRDDEENIKRIKFCKWRAVECFKKKKEQDENPQPKFSDNVDDDAGNGSNAGGTSNDDHHESSSTSSCPYPSGSDRPYPPASSSSTLPYPSSNIGFSGLNDGNNNNAKSNVETADLLNLNEPTSSSSAQFPTPAPRAATAAASKPKDDRQIQLEKELSSLTLSESDSKRAELLCESALYAIRANDLLTAVDTLKQTIELLYKRAKK